MFEQNWNSVVSDSIQLKNALIALMKENKVNIETLHKKTGVSIATIKRMRTDDTINPTLHSLIPIAKYFGTTLNRLVGNEVLGSQTEPCADEIKVQRKKLPVVAWEVGSQNTRSICPIDNIFVDISISDAGFALKIEDDDYVGLMKDAMLIIEPALEPSHNDMVVMHKEGASRYSFYKYIKHEDKIYLKPVKIGFNMTQLDETFSYIGVVIQMRMDTKKQQE